MEITKGEARAIGLMNHHPCLTAAGDGLIVEPCVAIDLAQMKINFDRRYALCFQKLYFRIL